MTLCSLYADFICLSCAQLNFLLFKSTVKKKKVYLLLTFITVTSLTLTANCMFPKCFSGIQSNLCFVSLGAGMF